MSVLGFSEAGGFLNQQKLKFMYNESELKTVWYAYKGGMKKYQIAQLMGIMEEDCFKMLEAARKKFGSIRKEKDEPQKERRPYFHWRAVPENEKQPLVRPPARYDNKSAEERIEELLNAKI